MDTPRFAIHHPDDAEGRLPIKQGRLMDFPDDPLACMRKLQAEFGEIAALEQDGQRIFFAFSPEYIHQILTDSDTFYSRFFAIRGPRNSPQRRLTGGLLSMNGAQHKRNRRLVMDAFTKKAIWGNLPTIRQQIEELLDDWRPGEERDINRDMTEFMLRLTSSILFGVDDPEVAYRIGQMVDHWVHLNHELGMGAFVSNQEIANRYDDLLDFAKELEADLLEMVQLRRQKEGAGNDVLSALINAHDGDGHITDEEMVGQAALIFGAAHLTTAHTLTWTLFLLAQHPSIMSELHAELERELTGGFPAIEQLERLSMVERVLKESMRIMPASAYLQRMTCQPVQLGPFALPSGAPVVFSQFMTHHLPQLYPEPEAFRPQRWLNIAPSPYEYFPFGAGSRMCIGGPMAMVILKSVLPTILQRFKVTAVPDSEVSARIISTMLAPTSKVMLRVDEQDGRFRSLPVTGNIHSMVELREVSQSVRRAA
ncbi:MAG: cytochrome P450 [Planctomycetaceae bacterium]